MIPRNQHCCVVEVAGCGILIKGASGTGKTSLALGILEQAGQDGLAAFMVADDQAMLWNSGSGLEASVPEKIAGIVEIRGFGISSCRYKPSTMIGLVVSIVDDGKIKRMPEPKTARMGDFDLPLVEVPRCHEQASRRIVFAWLKQNLNEVT